MSWSLTASGTPAEVEAMVDAANLNLVGQSRTEWEEAKPLLLGLVRQNFNLDPNTQPIIRLVASGSGTTTEGTETTRETNVTLGRVYT